MMKKIKGCGNESCEARKNKITYKDSEDFCSKCGSPLVYVCKDCYTQLNDDSEKLCIRCKAKHDDRRETVKRKAAEAGGGLLFVGALAINYGKKAIDFARKFKG